MEEMLKTIVKYLVDNPDAIEVTKRQEEKSTTLELRVAGEDMGKVIGKQGKMAKAIRTLMKAYATKEGTKINVDIMD
ncbi:MAG: KH domain-containing protein [Clostridia bacterium]|nr:KH domain-containing protein [Clostridia bacterium]